jgi:hypothetical protein
VTGPPPLRATRRRVLGAPAAVVVAGIAGSASVGCDVLGADERGPSDATSPTVTDGSTSEATSESAEPATDPDEALVARTREDVTEAATLVAAAGKGRAALRRELAPYRRLHAAHLAALPGDDLEVSPVRVRGDAAAARRRVRRGEQALQVRLADAAVEAQSGQLAALLASMSAAIAQRLGVGEPA